MKILYHHRTRAEDAQGIHIRELCEGFVKEGHQVEMVALLASKANRDHSKASKETTSTKGNSLFRLTIPHWIYELVVLFYNVPAFFVLSYKAWRFKPDFIYERYSLYAGAGYLVAKLFSIPFIIEVNSPLSLEMKKHGDLTFAALAQRMEDWIVRNAHATIVVTAAMKDIFVQRGANPKQFVVMPNGVDRKIFNARVDGSQIRRKYRLQDRFVVGFVGWIRSWHGVDYLISAVDRAVAEIPGLSCLIVGDGPAIPELKKQVAELQREKEIIFTGALDSHAIPQALAAIDVAVQPNVTEYASPIKLFEYLAMGKAIIAPDKDNIKEVVEDGHTALIYETGDIDQLAAHIKRLYHDPTLRHRLSQAAENLIEERGYYWQANARKVIALVSPKRSC